MKVPWAVMDSCALVPVLLESGEEKRKADVLHLLASHPNQIFAVMPTLVMLEVLGNYKLRLSDEKRAERAKASQKAQQWILAQGFMPIELDRRVTAKAIEFTYEHNLSGADAIVLASAVCYQAEKLYTYDDGLLKLRTKIEGLSVLKPPPAVPTPEEPDLFEA